MTRLAAGGRTRPGEKVARVIDNYFQNKHPTIEKIWSQWVAGDKVKERRGGLFPADPGERNVISSTIHSGFMLGFWYSGIGFIGIGGTLRTIFNVFTDTKNQALWQIMRDSYGKTALAVGEFWRDVIGYAVDHPKTVAAIYLTGKVIGKIAYERAARRKLIDQVADLSEGVGKLNETKDDILGSADPLRAAADKGINVGDLRKSIIDRELSVRLTKAGSNRSESEMLQTIRDDFDYLRIDCCGAGEQLGIDVDRLALNQIIKNIDDSIAECTRTIDAATAKINMSAYAAFGMRKFAIAMNIAHMDEVMEAVSNAYSAPALTTTQFWALTSSFRYAGTAWVIGKLQKAAEKVERAFSIPRGLLAYNIFYAPQIVDAIKNWVHSDNTFIQNLMSTASSLRFLIATIVVKIGIDIYNRHKTS